MTESETRKAMRLGRGTEQGMDSRPEQARVRRLIEQGLVAPAYQPILDVQRLEVAGREALARPTEASGFRHPGELFDEAERVGLVWEAEQATREVAVAGFAGSRDGSRLFVNASPAVIADERLKVDLLRALSRAPGLSPSRVVVEITERSAGCYTDVIVSRAEELRAAGFEIAVDDVGAGTSGLNRIMAIRPDWIKLDHDLITGIDADRNKRNLVKFLVSFGRLSGVRVLAEGIERREELSALLDLGVRYVQGFYIARPGEVDKAVDPAVLTWLATRQEELALGRLSDPRRVPLSRFARKAAVLEASAKVSEAATELLRDRTCRGFVLVSGTRVPWAVGRAVRVEPAVVVDAGALGELADVVQEGGQRDAGGLFEKFHVVLAPGQGWKRFLRSVASAERRRVSSSSVRASFADRGRTPCASALRRCSSCRTAGVSSLALA